jgi:hypothetical protein
VAAIAETAQASAALTAMPSGCPLEGWLGGHQDRALHRAFSTLFRVVSVSRSPAPCTRTLSVRTARWPLIPTACFTQS